MRPRSIVFDLFGDYIRFRGGEVRLRTMTALLECFGVSSNTGRVVMARLRTEGWFDSRRVGRETIYSLNAKSWRLLNEGRSRIFDRNEQPWDRRWHMVIYAVPEKDRAIRDQLRRELAWLGFGPLASSTWISPHDRLAAVEEHFADHLTVRLDVLSCRSKGVERDRDMARRCWALDALNSEYTSLLSTYHRRLSSYRSGGLDPVDAFVERMRLVHDYRHFPFRDPDLPTELLPAGWLGRDAHQLFLEAHHLLKDRAEEQFERVWEGARG